MPAAVDSRIEVVVVGPVTRDITVLIDEMPPDAGSVLAHELRIAPGGKGANPAVAALRLGAHVRLVGAVGQDEAGDAALADLAHLVST